MPRMIFVNLPVAGLKKSMAFYEAFCAVDNPRFSGDTAARGGSAATGMKPERMNP